MKHETHYLNPPDYEIHDEGGLIVTEPLPDRRYALMVDNREGNARAFKRNAVHSDKSIQRWLVGELDGVRLYCTEDDVFILTNRDVYPCDDLLDRLRDGAFDGIPG